MPQNMNVSVTLRFVDQFTAGIRQLQQQLQQFANTAQNINRTLGGSGSNTPLGRMQQQVRTLANDVRQLTSGFQGLGRASGGNFASRQLADLQQIVNLQRQIVAGNRAIAAGPGGGVGGAAPPGGHQSWYSRFYRGLGPAALFAPTHGQMHSRFHHGATQAFEEGLGLDVQRSMIRRLGLDRETVSLMTDSGRVEVPLSELAVERAREVARLVPSTNEAMNLHRFFELRYAFGDSLHALESMEMLAKAMGAINSMDPAGRRGGHAAIDQVMEMVKAGEMRGVVNDPKQFEDFISWTVRIAQSSGGLVDPRTIFSAYKYARTSLAGFSDEFLYTIFPEIMQEIKSGRSGGGSSAGVIADAFRRVVVSGRMSDRTRENWQRYGMLDAEGRPVGRMLGAENPFVWTEEHFFPLLRRLGIDPSNHDRSNIARMTNVASELFETRTANQYIDLFIVQHDAMKRRAEMTRRAMGSEDAYRESLDTLTVRFTELNSQTRALGQTITNMAKAPLMWGARGATGTVGGLNQLLQTSPALLVSGAIMGIGALRWLWRSPIGGFLRNRMHLLGPGGRMAIGGGLGFLLSGGDPTSAFMSGMLMREMATNPAATAAAGAAGAAAASRWSRAFLAVGRRALSFGFRFLMNPFLMFGATEIYQHWGEVSKNLKAIWADLWQALPTFLGGQGKGPAALTQGQGLAGADSALQDYMKPVGDWFLSTPWGQAMHARGLITTMEEYRNADWLRRNFNMGDLQEDARLRAQVPGAGTTGNTVNVTGTTINISVTAPPGADGQAVGAAAGNAVGSALRGVLGDVPPMP